MGKESLLNFFFAGKRKKVKKTKKKEEHARSAAERSSYLWPIRERGEKGEKGENLPPRVGGKAHKKGEKSKRNIAKLPS